MTGGRAGVSETTGASESKGPSVVDVEAYISRMEHLLAEARPVPLSASVMISRKDFEDLLAGLRATLPDELREARWIIKEREELLAQSQREAEDVLAEAILWRDRLVSDNEVVGIARRQAERILEEAREQALGMQGQAEDYIDAKLANFEIVLQKTLQTIAKGRERLRGRLASDALAAEELDEESEAAERAARFYDQEASAEH